MKTTKLISMLLLAILSFSCGEDEATKVQDDENKEVEIPNALEYLYQVDSKYTFEVEYLSKDKNGEIISQEEFESLLFIYGFLDYQDTLVFRYSIIVKGDIKEHFLFADSSILYSHNSIINNYNYEFFIGQGWIPYIDFSKDSWTVLDFKKGKNETGNYDIDAKTNATKEKEIVFEFQNQEYKGFEFTIISEINVNYYDENDNLSNNYDLLLTDKIMIVKELGIVKRHFIEDLKSYTTGFESKREWKTTLKEIEKTN